MENEMVLVFSSDKLYQVELAREILEENGIESEVMNKIDSLLPLGEAELYVNESDAEKALLIINEVR
jgi:hypothetical protein